MPEVSHGVKLRFLKLSRAGDVKIPATGGILFCVTEIFQQLSEFVVGGCGERAFKINRLADNAVAMSGWAAK